MRVSKEQVTQNRLALIQAARRLMRQRGLEGPGVAEVCREAGLTHGAFYRHFASREALMLEACAQAFDFTPQDVEGASRRDAGLEAIVSNYLSAAHRDTEGLGCPVAALAVDAARAEGEIAEGFAEGIETYLSTFTDALRTEGGSAADSVEAQAQALHMLAAMVGGLVIARATARARPALSQQVLRTLKQRLLASVRAAPH